VTTERSRGRWRAGKGAFAGPEVFGKKLGVVGLGAIGVMVANAGEAFQMEVLGFDPYLSVENAWGLSRIGAPGGDAWKSLMAEVRLREPARAAQRRDAGHTICARIARGGAPAAVSGF
jgi:phosphoglycerate dehydrogenase-like enzyme